MPNECAVLISLNLNLNVFVASGITGTKSLAIQGSTHNGEPSRGGAACARGRRRCSSAPDGCAGGCAGWESAPRGAIAARVCGRAVHPRAAAGARRRPTRPRPDKLAEGEPIALRAGRGAQSGSCIFGVPAARLPVRAVARAPLERVCDARCPRPIAHACVCVYVRMQA